MVGRSTSTMATRPLPSSSGSWPRHAGRCKPPPLRDPYSGRVTFRPAALVALVLLVAACSQSPGAEASHDLVLGAIYPLSGPQAAGGKAELAGVRAALEVAATSGALKSH